ARELERDGRARRDAPARRDDHGEVAPARHGDADRLDHLEAVLDDGDLVHDRAALRRDDELRVLGPLDGRGEEDAALEPGPRLLREAQDEGETAGEDDASLEGA